MAPSPIDMWNGRFAPSPTGDLHVGNLRTALVAWLVARSNGARFVVRMEDLDPIVSRREVAASQLRDLELIGLDWDGEVVFQSERHELYQAAFDRLHADELVYECYCTRKEIQAASQAPNGPQLDGRYPGTCRELGASERSVKRSSGRPPAYRLRSQIETGLVEDLRLGAQQFPVDDFVLRRNDGTWAYNLAVVVDDADQQIGTVVRADDLLSSTPRQQHLALLLNLAPLQYLHVPLVVNERGERLAKRDGAVTLSDRLALGESIDQVRQRLLSSLGLESADSEMPFDLNLLPTDPWVFGSTA